MVAARSALASTVVWRLHRLLPESLEEALHHVHTDEAIIAFAAEQALHQEVLRRIPAGEAIAVRGGQFRQHRAGTRIANLHRRREAAQKAHLRIGAGVVEGKSETLATHVDHHAERRFLHLRIRLDRRPRLRRRTDPIAATGHDTQRDRDVERRLLCLFRRGRTGLLDGKFDAVAAAGFLHLQHRRAGLGIPPAELAEVVT